jgi:phosphatidylinositol alpha-1,6-mannosyltransferase
MGILPTKINVIYPGVDIHLFKPGLDTADLRNSIDISQTDLLVFSVGRLSRRKGFDQMIRAVSLLHSEGMNIHYVIGGIGEDSDYLDKLIWEHGTENFIHRIGAVSEADLPRWMNACDIFAMPNREINGDNEGFGMVFIEASACGKPVLAGISGGTGAAVLDNVTGLRVDGTSVECIANGLRQILGDRQLAINLGNNGLERTIEMFSWERVANITESLHTKRKAEQ